MLLIMYIIVDKTCTVNQTASCGQQLPSTGFLNLDCIARESLKDWVLYPVE